MPARWPIRTKLWVGLGLLSVIVATLFGSAWYGLYAYRGLVKDLSARSTELPLADKLSRHVADLRITLGKTQAEARAFPFSNEEAPSSLLLRDEFRHRLQFIEEVLDDYRRQLDVNQNRDGGRIADDRRERETLKKIYGVMRMLKEADTQQDWFMDKVRLDALDELAGQLQQLASKLPSHLHDRLRVLAHDERANYRAAIILMWATVTGAAVMLVVFVAMFVRWIEKPIRILVQGSREVAMGQFEHHIRLEGDDEMTELADAMNAMTDQFRKTRDELDNEVKQQTKQVVRSEQLASVGFLAAGVAHEINNPLASIVLCSDSLESRLAEVLPDTPETSAEREVVQNYARMIQQEAFRCKQITEQLLDFSRSGDSERQLTDLRELVDGVIDMVRHLGKYNDKQIELADGAAVLAEINVQEMKQVALNLVTNALDSLEPDGRVRVDVRRRGELAEIVIEDNGCGMTPEIIEHIFEPFFTRSKGGQGTGLGLSITYRIISEHGGDIAATSEGPDRGSRFVVTLPLATNQHAGAEKRDIVHEHDKEPHHRNQAA